MILEFAQGAVRQIGRFIGGIPRAFGWSGAGGAVPQPRPTVITGIWADVSTTGTWADFPITGVWADNAVTGSWGD
jgi:hypothetical protein